MKQPIPRNGTEPLKVGDRVQIVPEWQDPGDDQFDRLVIEAPEDCTSVRIRTVIPSLVFQPGEWINVIGVAPLPAGARAGTEVKP